jgi:streptogrisin B
MLLNQQGHFLCKIEISSNTNNGTYDAAFCEVTSSNYSLSNTLAGTSNTLSTTISEPGVGTYVNFLGANSGQVSGYINSTNATITFDSGITTKDLVSVELFTKDGDSGGIFYSYVSSTNVRYTLGILKGGNSTTSYYSKANNINAGLGISRY